MVKRLIYAPRAFAFISSSSTGQIIDVSEDIVSGWVDRVDDDISHAELVLRNVDRKYVRLPDGRPVFQWDDLITIWLQRMPGQPVQVFTGFLDSVPGWQMYPGDCRIEASCTLKRLAYSWFDPGSLFFMDMANKRGWVYNPETGVGYNPNTLTDPETGKSAPTDGGMSGFFHEFVTVIGGWDPRMVMVGELDPSLLDKADKLRQREVDALRDDQSTFAEVMRRFIGLDAVDIQETDGIRNDGTIDPNIETVVKRINTKLKNTNVPIKFAVYAAAVRSGMNTEYAEGADQGPAAFGYGLFGMQPKATSIGLDNPLDHEEGGGTIGVTVGHADSIDGVKIVDVVGHIDNAIGLFRKKFVTYLNSVPKAQRKTVLQKLNDGDERASATALNAMNMPVAQGSSQSIACLDNADRYVRSAIMGQRVTVPNDNGASTAITLTWESEELLELLNDFEKKTVTDHYKSHHVSLVPYLYYAKRQLGDEILLTWTNGVHKESLYLGSTTDKDGGVLSLNPLFNKFKGRSEVTSVTISTPGETFIQAFQEVTEQEVKYMRNGVVGLATDGARMLLDNSIRIVVTNPTAPTPDWVGAPRNPSTDDNESELVNGFSFNQLAQFSTLAALQAQYTFDQVGTMAESLMLTGNRALLNDISCLDAAKQLAQGSLRNLMSLPSGRLCAYYPDYFGARRGPYWFINEIEIVNMGIQLTDGPLATHVYTTGDTTGPAYNQGIDFADRLRSRGVVSVFNVELLNSFLVPGVLTTSKAENDKRKINFDESRARKFLNKHGARPLREENPIVKHPWYEYLMAWQRFMQQWASCYDTNVEFTFQPEIMAGGILGFRKHKLQMYCKQVRHEFSYESGFRTSATLTAPAAIYDPATAGSQDPGSIPGMIIAGGINTVGA